MNRLGIMIDLSHAAESTFWDVLKYSQAPVIVSHSSASAIYRHDRNLTDEQLRALAAHGLSLIHILQTAFFIFSPPEEPSLIKTQLPE